MSKNRNQQRNQDHLEILARIKSDQPVENIDTAERQEGAQEPSHEALSTGQPPSVPATSEPLVAGSGAPQTGRGLSSVYTPIDEPPFYAAPRGAEKVSATSPADKETADSATNASGRDDQWRDFTALTKAEVPSKTTSVPAAQPQSPPFPSATPQEVKIMRNIDTQLNNYAAAMDPKQPTTQEDQGRWSHTLFQLIRSILVTTPEESFRAEWNAVLNYFHKNAGNIFNESFLFRAPMHWSGSASEFACFRRLCFVLIETADPQTRQKALARLNFDRAIEGLPEEARNRILSFYG